VRNLDWESSVGWLVSSPVQGMRTMDTQSSPF